jgi:hypothetical protein
MHGSRLHILVLVSVVLAIASIAGAQSSVPRGSVTWLVSHHSANGSWGTILELTTCGWRGATAERSSPNLPSSIHPSVRWLRANDIRPLRAGARGLS